MKVQTAVWPRGAGAWIGLAASPSFAMMALIEALHAPTLSICSGTAAMLPWNGMAQMYLLMALFHVSPWIGRVTTVLDRLARPEGIAR